MFFEQPTQHKQDHFIWAEKYRPTSLDDYLGNEAFKDTISEFIARQEIPHLLLHSHKPGTGKTTLAKLIANSIHADVLYINASDESGIDDVRQKITSFASTLGFSKLKILILDECDRISVAGQMALRNIMETFSQHTRFILTCNYVEKILEPLVSRCQSFHVQPPDKATVARHISSILATENITFNPRDFKVLMKYYPDIRRIIQTAQQHSTSGTLIITEREVIESDGKLKLLEILSSIKPDKDKLRECRQLLANNNISQYDDYYDFLYNHIEEFAAASIANVIVEIAEYQYRDVFVPQKEINFAACIVGILKVLKN